MSSSQTLQRQCSITDDDEINFCYSFLSTKQNKMTVKDDNEDDCSTAFTASLSSIEDYDDDDDSFYGEAVSSTTSKKNALKRRRRRRTVQFDHVEVRHYGRTVDDHPCCTTGPAITLSWEIVQEGQVWTMEEFEEENHQRRRAAGSSTCRRLSPKERRNMLLQEWNIPLTEIQNAMKRSETCRQERQETLEELKQCGIAVVATEEEEGCYMQQQQHRIGMMNGFNNGSYYGGGGGATCRYNDDELGEDHYSGYRRSRGFGGGASSSFEEEEVFMQDIDLSDDDDQPEQSSFVDCHVDGQQQLETYLLAY